MMKLELNEERRAAVARDCVGMAGNSSGPGGHWSLESLAGAVAAYAVRT
jgi:hypothetical protein